MRLLVLAILAEISLCTCRAQDLAPRADVISPVHLNALTLTWGGYDGSIDFNGTLPISGATGTYSVPLLSYYHSFSAFGCRSTATSGTAGPYLRMVCNHPSRPHATGELPHRSHAFAPSNRTPVPEAQLQRWHLRPIWRNPHCSVG